jgi:predicted transcriptional regulator
MPRNDSNSLSRRERQIMDVLFREGETSAASIQAALPDAPGYSAVRALLRILVDKGHVRQRAEGQRYLYRPAARPEHARRHALRHVVTTFFGGSAADAAAALLDPQSAQLRPDELDRLQLLIDRAKQEGR